MFHLPCAAIFRPCEGTNTNQFSLGLGWHLPLGTDPSPLPDEWDKPAASEMFGLRTNTGVGDTHQDLLDAVPHRDNKSPIGAQLIDEWLRKMWSTCRDDDCVIGRMLGQS
jgi:hypothetical protein